MNSASVIGKILIRGEIVLKSPLLIGDGEGETSDNFKDIHVQKNQNNIPYIPGTSLAGVLREFLSEIDSEMTEKIFGDADKMQSSIQIDDIELENFKIISRDGVSIDSLTGIGIKGGKFDYEVVERGASGNLQMLINLRGCHVDDKNFTEKNYSLEKIKNTATKILQKLSAGISLGALTAKGLGKIQAKNISAEIFDFRKKADVISWLTDKNSAEKILPSAKEISANPDTFIVDADFIFNSSFIVRDYLNGEKISAENKISAVSLKSLEDFVIPGTSWKGIFRHRANYILKKLQLEKNLDNLLGTAEGEKIKSRLQIEESYIKPQNVSELPHTRNKIDRFTGGTLQGTLFTTKPVWQKNSAPTLHLHFEIKKAENFDAGLAIFILRDLWLGKVAIGGEKSVGRGTLTGLKAEIKFQGKNYLLGEGGKIIEGDKNELTKFAAAVRGEKN